MRALERMLGIATLVAMVAFPLPVSAADVSTVRPVLGGVSAVGAVDLRGVRILQEGTLFAGDRILAHEKAYAKVLLAGGSKIEVSDKTEFSVNRDAAGVKIAMYTGIIGFSVKSPVRIDVMPFEVTATEEASGNIAIMSSTTAGVRVISGKVTVRNLKTSESFVLTKGREQLLGLQNGVHAAPLAEIAARVPEPLPSPKRQQPTAGKTSHRGFAMDAGSWLALAGGAALGAVSVGALVETKNSHADLGSLKSAIGTLNSTIAGNQGTTAAQLNGLSNASNIALLVTQQAALLAQAAPLAVQARVALPAAGNLPAVAAFENLQSQIASQENALNILQTQISATLAHIGAGTPGASATLTTLLSQAESLRNQTNNVLLQEKSLLVQNSNTVGVPSANNLFLGIPFPVPASASVPE